MAIYTSFRVSKRGKYLNIGSLIAIPILSIVLIIFIPRGDFNTLWKLIPSFGVVAYSVVFVTVLPKDLKTAKSWISYLIVLVGLFTYICKIPDRLAPGRFDVVGSGHQIMHICVVITIATYSSQYRGRWYLPDHSYKSLK